MEQIKHALRMLKKPSVLISLISQLVTLLIALGLDINKSAVMAAAALLCSILACLGILSNPSAGKQGFGDDLLVCSRSGKVEPHTLVNGQMVCRKCGAVYDNPQQCNR